MLPDIRNHPSNLPAVLASRRPQFRALAEAWLATGAHTFTIGNGSTILASWPAASDAHADLVAPICVGGAAVGELRVGGLNDAASEARLRAEAGLIAHMVMLEDELEGMTAELIDIQDQQLALYDLTQSTRSHLDISQTLQSLSREAARLVKAQGAFLVLRLGETEPVFAQHPHALLDEASVLESFAQVQRQGWELVLNSPRTNFTFPTGIHNLLCVPITIREAQRAALVLVNKQGGPFNAPDLKLARTIADQAGAQIENVLLYEETLAQARLRTELDLAARIQLRLLPQKTPRVAGLDLSARSRPALQVGGDFYDLMQQPGQPFLFVVGDVSGKGMSAALLMAISRTMIRSRGNSVVTRSPEEILGCVFADLYDDFTEVDMFATAFLARYDHTKHELTYVNAGHSPVIYCPANGGAVLLQADGTPIGVLPASLSENQTLRFEAGDVLIAATDGFSEARGPSDEMFGYDRLLRLVEALRDQPAHVIAGAFFDAVERFAVGHPQDDDQTLVVVKGVGL